MLPVIQRCLAAFICLAAGSAALGQTNFSVYSDQTDNGFGNWSYGANNFANTTPVHSGTHSIAFSGGQYQGISLARSTFNPAPYTNLSFWITGGAAGGQVVRVDLQYGTNSSAAYFLPPLPASTNWEHFFLTFSDFNAAGTTNLYRLNFVLTSISTGNPFYLDDINLTANPPTLVHLTVDANNTVRPADNRWFGLNTAVWDGSLDTPTTTAELADMGTKILRFPGGSLSDVYHWTTNASWNGGNHTWTTWGTSFTSLIHAATNVGAQAMITVDYGMGTTNEAAAWVKAANVTNHLGFKCWEVGNECYGTWETDSNHLPNDPFTYATRARDYITAMKAADPTIEVGVVAAPGENSYSNNATHFAINPRTGTTNYGWTPIMLSTLSAYGVKPDFLIHHVYPEYGNDDDQALLLDSGNWPSDAGDLRQQITDYFGPSGTNIELLCTENNSDSGNQGKQSTSIVNGVYMADSLAQLMKTEINSFIWWDLRNGTDTAGDFNAALYGWRTYGDLGVINGLNTRHPVYYAFKLMQLFAHAGDTVLSAGSDYQLLPSYASRKADGSLAVLVINKDRYATFSSQVNLANFIPWTNAMVRSFGIAQDEATRTNSLIPGAKDLATNSLAINGTNILTTFPPYTITLITIPPAPPTLAASSSGGNQFHLQVQGQAKVRYVLQSSTDFKTWQAEATNTLAGNAWNISTNLTVPAKFWRAVWLPQ